MYENLLTASSMRAFRNSLLPWLLVALTAVVRLPAAYGAGKAAPGRWDLDGDHRSDTAVTKLSGSTLKIKIHLSGINSRVVLSTVVRYEPGLMLVAYDVDNDKKVDLVLTSIFSVRPVAVWLNGSNGRFKKASGWIAAFPIHEDGPQIRHKIFALSEHDALSWADPLPVLWNAGSAEACLEVYGRAPQDGHPILLTRGNTSCSERAPPAT